MTGMVAYGEKGSVLFTTESGSPVFLGKATNTATTVFNWNHQYQSSFGVYSPLIRWLTYSFTSPNSDQIIPFVKTRGFSAIQFCERTAGNTWTIRLFSEVGVGADVPEVYIFGPPYNHTPNTSDIGLVVYDRNGKAIFSTSQRHIQPIGLGSVLTGPNVGASSRYWENSIPVIWGRQESWYAPMFKQPRGIPLVFMNSTDISNVMSGSIQYYRSSYYRAAKVTGNAIEVRWGCPNTAYQLPYNWGNYYGNSQRCNVIVLDSADYD